MTSDILQRGFDFMKTKLGRLDSYSVLLIAAVTPVLVFGSGFTLGLAKERWKIKALAKKRKQKTEECRQALRALTDKIATNGKVSAERQQEIGAWSLCQLVDKLQSGEVLAEEVLETYQHKALEAHQKTNCLVEPILEAEAQALSCDTNGGRRGPMHGIPVSLKENYGVKGYDTTAGCAVFIGQPAEMDAVIVQVLKKQGAIPFVKTNIPQTMISWETSNPIYGSTVNPHDLSRGVGGSSGGEGALLAAGGSLLGFGSDIGGSIRIPSALCGVYGLKPTVGRLSSQGSSPIGRGQTIIPSTFGPMACDVDSLVTVMRALLVPYMFELDNTVPPLPFNEQMYSSKRPLRIGYYTQDSAFHAVPACERAVHVAKTALQKQGHELIPVTFPDLGKTSTLLWGQVIFGDKGQQLYDILKHDAVDMDAAMGLYFPLSLSIWWRKVLVFVLKLMAPDVGRAVQNMLGISSVAGWWELVTRVQEFRQSVRAEWRKRQLDVVICPGFGCPALPFADSARATGAVIYTSTYNVLDFPAGSVPVTKVTEQDVAMVKDYPASDVWHQTVKKGMQGSEGLPVGVQVVALPWQEELCLRVMKELETALKQGL